MPGSILRLLIAVSLLAAAPLATADSNKSLSFFHTHTGETLTVRYWANGAYDPEALEAINAFLADWRDGTRVDMDPELLDALHAISEVAGGDGTFEVISAYRSPQTNEMLRGRSNNVASKSQHLLGKAIDVRLRGVDTARLRDIALALGLGGVGYYGSSDFIHVDTGRVRRW